MAIAFYFVFIYFIGITETSSPLQWYFTKWEKKHPGAKVSEAKAMLLYALTSPLEKMDSALTQLTACEKLDMSSNYIEKIANLNGLKLKSLYLSRNRIRNLNGLEPIADTLVDLRLGYNRINTLKGIGTLKKLKVLHIEQNHVASWTEFERLADLPLLEELLFIGNYLEWEHTNLGDWRQLVKKRIPWLKKLDGIPFGEEEEEEEEEEESVVPVVSNSPLQQYFTTWERTHAPAKVSEAKSMNVHFKIKLTKMDHALAQLTACENLDLSNNKIEAISNLNRLKLKRLNLNFNRISSLKGLEPIGKILVDLRLSDNEFKTMDHPLTRLTACEIIDLSSNKIEKIQHLQGTKLKSLNLNNNLIRNLNGLENIADTLVDLRLSDNHIHTLRGISNLKKLKVLHIGENFLNNWDEFDKLKGVEDLEELTFEGNPLQFKHSNLGDWREQVKKRLPGLKILDGEPIEDAHQLSMEQLEDQYYDEYVSE